MLEKHHINVLDKEFIVRTYSTFVADFKNINHNGTYKQERLIRWQIKLAEHYYSISYIKGENNVLAYILSREWNEAHQKKFKFKKTIRDHLAKHLESLEEEIKLLEV